MDLEGGGCKYIAYADDILVLVVEANLKVNLSRMGTGLMRIVRNRRYMVGVEVSSEKMIQILMKERLDVNSQNYVLW